MEDEGLKLKTSDPWTVGEAARKLADEHCGLLIEGALRVLVERSMAIGIRAGMARAAEVCDFLSVAYSFANDDRAIDACQECESEIEKERVR